MAVRLTRDSILAYLSNYNIIRLILNTESNTLWLSVGNSHANHSNMKKGTFPESWTPCPENSMYLGSI